MRPDWVDARVPALRRRLSATGDLPAAEARTGDVVDPATVAAVSRFQARHGLATDGIAGRRTVQTMNVSAADRVAQIMVNYDRLRALARTLPPTGVIINIPAATLQLMVDSRIVLTSRIIVGRPSWPTPLLESAIGQIELNPYWNVPPRIARLELLPRIAREPAYLAANDMRVLGGPGGEGETAPAAVDWSRFLALGYRLRQDPGPRNPLGAIKFSFPNGHAVYLHDTPDRRLFELPDRALSHGCMRVERAFDLAVALLAADPAWNAETLRAAIATGRHSVLKLARRMPVRTVYVTAWPGPDGAMQFRPDIYARDAREAADRPPSPPTVQADVGCGGADTAAALRG
jgi:murein L,D-transpeptidase YcbB/YkuD